MDSYSYYSGVAPSSSTTGQSFAAPGTNAPAMAAATGVPGSTTAANPAQMVGGEAFQQGGDGSVTLQQQHPQGYVNAGPWFGYINPSLVTGNSLNSSALQDSTLGGYTNQQLSQLNQNLGGHAFGDNFTQGNGQYSFGRLPGTTAGQDYLGQFANFNGNAYRPDQYNSVVDQYNNFLNSTGPWSTDADENERNMSQFRASNIDDVYKNMNNFMKGFDPNAKQYNGQAMNPFLVNYYNNNYMKGST